ncbi:D-alanyl-D-alanine carboxypeptidase family protein [Gilvimarinus sp. F26214L]|uniref:D-alanyl-D-alanine carboxypeptidase family protein n=1 Tax=Gilvimarinus sp. DZF01 TaxID=3461371 RepID=UPI004045BCBB
MLLVGVLSSTANVQAESVLIPAPPQLAATGYLLIDANTGEVLVEHNADELLPPASLTKMMTSYIVSGEIARGSLSEDTMVNISVKAWKMGGSKMFIREGTQVSVKDLLRGVIVQSGNDASVALAEQIAGSEDAFVDLMNQQAALLGMTSTHFKNATGWPAEGHVTTARDLAKLARALIRDYPDHYALYSEKYFQYNGINQPNRNKLLFRDPSVDGIKTGHTEEAGYCLVSSSKKDDMRLIAVVMGARSEDSRAAESQKLLTYGFRYFQTHRLYSPADEISSVRVWQGLAENLPLGVAEDIFLTIPRGAQSSLKATMHIDEVIKAPIAAGQELGNVTVELNGEQLLDVPLVAQDAIERAGFFARIWDSLKLFFMDLFSLL